jgi:hypothetical protein
MQVLAVISNLSLAGSFHQVTFRFLSVMVPLQYFFLAQNQPMRQCDFLTF